MLKSELAALPETLKGSLREYRVVEGADLLARVDGFYKWQDARRREGYWPYGRSTDTGPRAVCDVADDAGLASEGVNFGSQDYLGLSGHPAIREAAHAAIDRYGVHSAGSAAFMGNTGHSIALEKKISEFLGMERVVLYPTGYAAGAGVIKGLVRSGDYVVMDALAHACLQDGAASATKNVYLFRHLEIESARRWLAQIRAKDTTNGILVVTEGLFSMDSDTPDIMAMQDLCHEFNATLMVDVAHDLGCLGEDGRGHIGMQKMLGKVDIVMGSFSKTFASNGGFVACPSRSVQQYLRYFSTPGTFSNALSPIQAAVALKAFEIVDSAEGRKLRQSLMANILALRSGLKKRGLEVYGDPSAIVAVKMGTEATARLVSRQLIDLGLVANMVEYPAVPKGAARFRLQVMANHTNLQIQAAIACMKAGHEIAALELEEILQPEMRAVA
ncbi:aminotransferase class I/II-fold pyridoxal phosphate-dependent enzyme [Methylocapsa sp. S129]|uniref:aminotransferase class I/II-fold pyridoxal phosphate-dependent enzyme n=1 Tax=Methylocapsa sp. S129 TaxID=1641869 RepID=UPI001FF02227|nr:aminotransferase class I/II-fold pyridoxal phosphate-dependent enzyme [Methylocapsa sp. S129]